MLHLCASSVHIQFSTRQGQSHEFLWLEEGHLQTIICPSSSSQNHHLPTSLSYIKYNSSVFILLCFDNIAFFIYPFLVPILSLKSHLHTLFSPLPLTFATYSTPLFNSLFAHIDSKLLPYRTKDIANETPFNEWNMLRIEFSFYGGAHFSLSIYFLNQWRFVAPEEFCI